MRRMTARNFSLLGERGSLCYDSNPSTSQLRTSTEGPAKLERANERLSSQMNSIDRISSIMPRDIPDQVLNRTNPQPPPLPELQAPISPHHPSIHSLRPPRALLPILHQLTNDTHRCFARKATKLHRGFRMPRPLAHTAFSGAQWEDMAWAAEGVWRG